MTTTQIKQAGAASHAPTTCSVTTGTPTVTSTARDFINTDVGRTITTVNTAGRAVLRITDAYTMVMDGNATGSSGPQTCTMAAALVNVTKGSGVTAGLTSKSTTYLPALPSGSAALALMALNVWTFNGGTGAQATWAQKILAGIGLVVQET